MIECFTKKRNIFKKHSILDVWHSSKYTSGFLKFYCRGSQRDSRDFSIYTKLIIVLTPNLELSSYSNVIHGSTTFKLTKSSQRLKKNDNYLVWCFWSLFHFIFVSDNKCHKQKWCVLFFLHVSFCHSFYCHLEKINWYNLTKLFLQEYIQWKWYNKIHI